MTRAAADHVDDLVRTKRLGHTGSDGSAPAQRLNPWKVASAPVGVPVARAADATAAVAQMIIDDGVASRAQRRGLLSDRAPAVGTDADAPAARGDRCVTLAGGYGPPPLEEARTKVADAVNLPDDFEEVLFSVPVVDIHDRVYQALERGGKVVLDYAPGALKLSVWDAAGKGVQIAAVDWDPALARPLLEAAQDVSCWRALRRGAARALGPAFTTRTLARHQGRPPCRRLSGLLRTRRHLEDAPPSTPSPRTRPRPGRPLRVPVCSLATRRALSPRR